MLLDCSPVCPVCMYCRCIVAKQLDGSRCYFVQTTEVGLSRDHIVLAPPWKGAQQPSLFGRCLLWPNGRPSQQLLSSCSVFTQHGTTNEDPKEIKRHRTYY